MMFLKSGPKELVASGSSQIFYRSVFLMLQCPDKSLEMLKMQVWGRPEIARLTSSQGRLVCANPTWFLITLGAASTLPHTEHTLFIGSEHRVVSASADVIRVFSMVINTSSGNDCSRQRGL